MLDDAESMSKSLEKAFGSMTLALLSKTWNVSREEEKTINNYRSFQNWRPEARYTNLLLNIKL